MTSYIGFCSVVAITLASHARGPGFETQQKQLICILNDQIIY